VRLDDVLLYLVVDLDKLSGAVPAAFCKSAIAGGADLVHLRGSLVSDSCHADLADIASVCRDDDALLVIEDSPQAAAAVDADGVHLGNSDGSVGLARAMAGMDKLVGISTRTPNEVSLALEVGADYVLHFGGRSCIGTFAGQLGVATVPLFAAGLEGLDDAAEIVEHGILRLCVDGASLDETHVEEQMAEYSRLLGRCI